MRDFAGELNQAGVYFQQNNLKSAEKISLSILEESPDNVEALNILGGIYATKGSPDRAIQYFGQAAELSPDDSRLHFNIGRCHQLRRDLPSAQQAFRSAIEADADNLAAWTMLSKIYQSRDNMVECVGACDQILRLAVAGGKNAALRTDAYIGMGTAEIKLGNFETAIKVLSAAIRENPNDPRAHSRLGDTYRGQGQNAKAVESFLKAASLRSQPVSDWTGAAIAYLRDGNHHNANELLQKCLSVTPGNRRVLSVYGPLLWEMKRDSEYHVLFDYENLIQAAEFLEPPSGYLTLDAFHQALIHEISGHSSLTGERVTKSTTGGFQTGNIFTNPQPAADDLVQIINARISAYISDEQNCPGTPGTEWAAEWDLIGWGVILHSQGYQSAHNHPSGMVSGVYYIKVPEEVHDSGDYPGCIEFGPPNDMYRTRREPPRHRYLAEEGRMYLFPSHYWHRTIPFESCQERICIAFDAIPRAKLRG
ncbi:MAG: tetratricopeptide repeat protein [Rhodospirillales bacterium]|nr:tetratricopeptide repeat protein [Rhodospirillales bacterium]MBT4039936.1 tetratricopeptide repeat protein [Rhodospirillales bacterium]MBT4626037.1 tetratricopeptide repeat protein [Rhodospirillales bacterium]MBT5351309.1 tetratricopeptide repeat protein [Rhodospirillales bacterium]MBT5521945.1 tetratricopeptide repeat protein [Rhodospirillales bacterium]